MKEILIIGGGASGMAAAYAASLSGDCHVTLLEKNEKLGKKIYITGKGRCNLTNACPTEDLFAHVVSNPKFLYSAFYTFSNEDVCRLISEAGCPVKTERGNRVFPVSDHASDVTRAWEKLLRKNGVTLVFSTEASCIRTEDGRIKGVEAGTASRERRFFPCDALILATGGLSYALTGSTGDGYLFAKELGHSVSDCTPSLVPLETKEEWPKELSGLALKNISITCKQGKQVLFSEFGELLFTHFGISGPVVLSASAYLPGSVSEDTPAEFFIDMKPALDRECLDKRLLRDFKASGKKMFKTVLAGLVPSALIPVICRLSMVPDEKQVSDITKEERKRIADTLKGVPITVIGTRGYEEAVITKGGVSVKEIDASSMRSKKMENLFFAGELIDVDALTGGFNLQIAWSTGFLAGKSACDFTKRKIKGAV